MTWKLLPTLILGVFITGAALGSPEPSEPVTEKDVPSAESIKVPSSVKNPKDYGHHASYLLVTCMDFRLRDEVAKFMELRVGTDTYDEFVIAGASLGAFNEKFPHWEKTFEDTVGLSMKLHGITHVIFLDHRNCGAYKMLKGDHCCDDKAEETHVHAIQFEAVRKMMKEKFPQIKVETLLMGLDGQVETVHPENVKS